MNTNDKISIALLFIILLSLVLIMLFPSIHSLNNANNEPELFLEQKASNKNFLEGYVKNVAVYKFYVLKLNSSDHGIKKVFSYVFQTFDTTRHISFDISKHIEPINQSLSFILYQSVKNDNIQMLENIFVTEYTLNYIV